MKKLFLSLLLLCCVCAICAQPKKLSYEERKAQIKYIKNDTLPVFVTPLPDEINSKFSEYNGILFPDSSFFFTSMRYETDEDYDHIFELHWSGRIYESQWTENGYGLSKAMDKTINHPRYFTSNFTFNHDRTLIIFSRCLKTPYQELKCQLWESRYENNEWKKPKKLGGHINLTEYSSSQPFLVEHEDKQILYFASNRPKGYGGMDIWYSVVQNGKYENPINAGSYINTEGNEITPFYDKKEEILYFSSDEHLGIGGYDIFYAQGALSSFTIPTNMGVPFNSEENDFYFNINEHPSGSGYFSSNRPTPNSAPEDTCCNDIFYYEWEKSPIAEQEINTIEKIETKIANILPISLYFHNDEPDPKSWSADSRQNYYQLLKAYVRMKELYIEEAVKGLTGNLKSEAASRMKLFFEDSIEQGFEKLLLLTEYLFAELQSGKNITLEINGYASPLHQTDYNKLLSARRIASMKNFLMEYHDGIFIPYLIGEKKNRLTLIALPHGSQTTSTKTGQASIYGIDAVSQRKIVIERCLIK